MPKLGGPPRGKESEDKLASLIFATARGDTSEFNLLIELVRKPLTVYIRGKTSLDDYEVDAIFNVIMMKVWKSAWTWKGVSAWGWVYTVAKNTVKSYLRKIRKEKAVDETSLIQVKDGQEIQTPYEMAISEDINPERAVISKENLAELYASLDPKEKTILDCIAEGYSQKDIAEKLGLSPGRVSQITKFIKTKIEEWSKEIA